MHYGTEHQKKYYLPRLATGIDVPCFALTSPDAGSDAGAMTDSGVIMQGTFEGESVLGIQLNWNKRYITLAPIATVLGVAFRLFDPDHHLGQQEDLGITLCLIPTHLPGIRIGERHFPLNMSFMNGPTQGNNVFVPLSYIIGGEKMAGQGWRMLMECLSAGRGISLPALSISSGKIAYRMTGAYAKIRKQFKVSIGEFEGVEESMARIAGYTYLMEATRLLTTYGIDQGKKPSVISAITKYHLTEMARKVITEAMDIHGGRGVMLGPKNYLARAYEGIPISITVEGANILTRNLIIYGQGAIRCHPYVQAEMACTTLPDAALAVKKFDTVLGQHVAYTLSQAVRTLVYGLSQSRLINVQRTDFVKPYIQHCIRMSTALALVSDVAMLVLGGKLKRKERLSARLGDVLSYLYMAASVVHYYDTHQKPEADTPEVHWTLQYCLFQCQQAFIDFCINFPNKFLGKMLRTWIFPFGRPFTMPSDALSHQLAQKMMQSSEFRDRLTQDCYLGQGEDDLIGIMEITFEYCLRIAPIERKIHQAIKAGIISKEAEPITQFQQAREKAIIEESEFAQLIEYEHLRQKAIAVDAFPKEYLTRNAACQTFM
jgi:alkylation response protein AidB-like acyl-CoA dehydrogenase